MFTGHITKLNIVNSLAAIIERITDALDIRFERLMLFTLFPMWVLMQIIHFFTDPSRRGINCLKEMATILIKSFQEQGVAEENKLDNDS